MVWKERREWGRGGWRKIETRAILDKTLTKPFY